MAEIRETQVERDADGRVVGQTERVEVERRKGGGFGWGMLLGVLVIAGAIIAFAYNSGSFQQAGAAADRAAAVASENTGNAAADARQAVGETAQSAGTALEQAGQEVQQSSAEPQENTAPN